jgi:Flp pilus assembly protein CpaB
MHVDVLVTGRPPGGEGDMTTTCLQNMLVLSSGTTLQPDARGQAINAPTVTLLATPDQAETLTLANVDGHIQLILRNSTDAVIETTPGRYIEELYSTHRRSPVKDTPVAPVVAAKPKPKPVETAQAAPPPVVVPVLVAAPAPPPPPDQVIIIRGSQRTVETLPARVN